MPTKNRRVATYLPKEIDERFTAFKSERGIEVDSQALITILSEFLEVAQPTTQIGESPSMNYASNETLDKKLTDLRSELLSELQSKLLTIKTEIKDELLSELSRSETVPGQLELLSSLELSSEPNSELHEDQQSTVVETPKLVGSHQTFKTAELAKRLKIDSSTISHWKPAGKRPKSPEALLEATRKEDPDGIGWIYLPDVNLFKPEREIPSELPKEPTSSSLGDTEPEF